MKRRVSAYKSTCHIIGSLFLIQMFILTACHQPINNTGHAPRGEIAGMHSSYDDSTLTNASFPIMMPYNRLIAPAGKTIKFGDPHFENHSLDAQFIHHTTLLAVEDRYGIALIDTGKYQVIARWAYNDDMRYKGLMSTYSGLKIRQVNNEIRFFWSAADADTKRSYVMQAIWNGRAINISKAYSLEAVSPVPLALPNDIAITTENGSDNLYIVLNGNNQLVKIDLNTGNRIWAKPTGVAPYGIVIIGNHAFVTNWGGPIPIDTLHRETAGVPYGRAYIDPKTGATSSGTVQVIDIDNGATLNEIPVGLHPNAIIADNDKRFVYVSNANSDNVSVIDVQKQRVIETIPVKLITGEKSFIGDSPNALALNTSGTTLYVANGLDNAVAVIKLGSNAAVKGSGHTTIKGFIPTGAYPGGLSLNDDKLFVTNLEGEGSWVNSLDIPDKGNNRSDVTGDIKAYNAHHQQATVSIIAIPDDVKLASYTAKVKALNLTFREELAHLSPRKNMLPKPMPERIGEPSVFDHVLYIIKENRTYDQVLGDMPQGKGAPALCIYGDTVTPNQHQLARDFLLLDNFNTSGKCSAEGHQWADAGMVTDNVEKNVRAWFRSYPHVQADALVYGANGFIWNNAADHGKKVRIYGEASVPHYDEKLTWSNIYNNYQAGKPFKFYNTSTISRVRPMLSQNYPASDELKITDQIRASAFIDELKDYERQPGDNLPQLMVMALSADHTEGIRPGFPVPQAMVADNDLALGRIIEAISKSRFWKNTVIFVTEDDSQDGWDHISAYRTTGFVISPYSTIKKTVSTNYNQTCMVRSIEQILGIPPMNIIDATALPMYNCFTDKPSLSPYHCLPNKVKLNRITPAISTLKGRRLFYAKQSLRPEFDHIDGGDDDRFNRILWFAAKGNKAYPARGGTK